LAIDKTQLMDVVAAAAMNKDWKPFLDKKQVKVVKSKVRN
jgi:hypothetical protein